MNLLDKTAAFFGTKKTQPSNDIQDLMAGVTARLDEIERRQSAINSHERQTVLEQGDAAAVEKLDAEVASLKSEELALLARRSRLHQEFKAARTAEALADAGKSRARLAESVGSIESMRAQLADAEYSLKRQLDSLRESRQLAGNDPRLDLNPELANRIAEILLGDGRNNVLRDDRQRLVNEFSPARRQPAKGKAAPAKGALTEQAGVYQ